MKNKKKKIVPLFLLLIIGIGGSLYYWGRDSDTVLVLRGEVEGTIYSQFVEVPGKIIEMNIELGCPVKAGDLLARLDSTDQEYALEQLQMALEKRRLTLITLLKGTKPEELQKARSDVNIAEASYKQTRDETAAMIKIWETGGLSQNDLDKAMLKETVAAGALETARNQLSLLQRGTDIEIIALAEQDILDAESRIRQIQGTLEKYEIRANCDGILISVNYNLGSMVNAGYNLADISADKEKYVVCYVPKDHSTLISYGQSFTVKSGKNEFNGEIRFIDVKSQYTPKDMQNSATRNKVSVKVKLLLPASTILNPGNPVDVVFRLHQS